MAQQGFISYGISDPTVHNAVAGALESAGFVSYPRTGPMRGLNVRILEGTDDRAEVEEIVSRIAPEARRLPDSAPAKYLPGYRE